MPINDGQGGDSLLLKDDHAAELLQVSRAKVWRLMQTGELAYIKIGRSRRIPRAAVEDFVARLVAEAS